MHFLGFRNVSQVTPFHTTFDESRFSDICTIMDLKELNCVNIWKTSEAANLVFQWIVVLNSIKRKFFHVSIIKKKATFVQGGKVEMITFQRNRHFRKVSVNKTFTHVQEQKKAMSPRHSTYIPSSVKSEKSAFFSNIYFALRKFLQRLRFISMYRVIEYWIKFQNIFIFTYQKALLHALLLLVFKIVDSLQCILKTVT